MCPVDHCTLRIDLDQNQLIYIIDSSSKKVSGLFINVAAVYVNYRVDIQYAQRTRTHTFVNGASERASQRDQQGRNRPMA